MSARALTMAGFLPPISTTTGWGKRLLKVRKTELKPISNEPVKSRPSIPGFSCSSAPTVAPGPLTRLKTPRRQAGRLRHLGQLDAAQRGVAGGLVDDRVAGHERSAGGSAGEGHREVEGADDRPHAVRLEHRAGVDGAVAQVAHRVVEAVVGHELVAVVADQVGRLLDVAEGLQAVLADFDPPSARPAPSGAR